MAKEIADEALDAISDKDDEKVKKDVSRSHYKPGNYRSDRFLRIIKELSHKHAKDANGNIQKTYGTWATDSNMIVFSKGVERRLTEDELKLPSIQRLIDSKVIYRVGD